MLNKKQTKIKGAHVCGFAGKNTQKLGRISGKWIIFWFPNDFLLDKIVSVSFLDNC